MAFWDWATTNAGNGSVGGINIAEGCPAGNLNNSSREIMAEARAAFNVALQAFFASTDIPTARAALSALGTAGGALTGDINQTGFGRYLYFADPTLTTPRIIYLAVGDPDPSPLLPGMILVTLT